MFPVHQVWPKPSCKAQWKGEEDKADKGRGGKTTSGNGQAWSSPSPRGQWRTGKKMEKTGCKIICGAPTTLAVKGLMMMMMVINRGWWETQDVWLAGPVNTEKLKKNKSFLVGMNHLTMCFIELALTREAGSMVCESRRDVLEKLEKTFSWRNEPSHDVFYSADVDQRSRKYGLQVPSNDREAKVKRSLKGTNHLRTLVRALSGPSQDSMQTKTTTTKNSHCNDFVF